MIKMYKESTICNVGARVTQQRMQSPLTNASIQQVRWTKKRPATRYQGESSETGAGASCQLQLVSGCLNICVFVSVIANLERRRNDLMELSRQAGQRQPSKYLDHSHVLLFGIFLVLWLMWISHFSFSLFRTMHMAL